MSTHTIIIEIYAILYLKIICKPNIIIEIYSTPNVKIIIKIPKIVDAIKPVLLLIYLKNEFKIVSKHPATSTIPAKAYPQNIVTTIVVIEKIPPRFKRDCI